MATHGIPCAGAPNMLPRRPPMSIWDSDFLDASGRRFAGTVALAERSATPSAGRERARTVSDAQAVKYLTWIPHHHGRGLRLSTEASDQLRPLASSFGTPDKRGSPPTRPR